jgi:curved DNA-binding protein CbpA
MSGKEEFADHYALLGIDYDAENTDIKKAYLKLAKEAHPDAGGSTEAMQTLNHAYRTLMVPEKRAAYNKLYSLHNRVALDDLELKEDDYDIPRSNGSKVTEYDDFFVDQIYAEYYEPEKKPKWKGKFKRK